MRKYIVLLALHFSGLLTAQTETVVTVNGQKVDIDINTITTANNGLTASNPNVQLGGKLIKPTTINTNNGQLQIKRNTAGAIKITDGNQATGKILTSDTNGLATWQNAPDPFHNALYFYLLYPGVKPGGIVVPQSLTLLKPDSYTAQLSGKYMIVSHTNFKNVGTPGTKQFYFEARTNSGTVLCSNEVYKYAESYFIDHYAAIVNLNAGDVVSFYWKTDSNPQLVIEFDNNYNSVEIVYLGQ